ncbi:MULTISPECIES: 4'-phosphopantetheinyl transferase family protein [Rhizobium]|uniref:4'-phosphopantetheinyl transferase family protein n=1 Tax=Rhizobium TaxID=379 RepID=UPI001FD8E572|nr:MULTISPECIES: 4'-phosphopantetheinyl transferase superfamily protein [Rhizobium]
MKVFGEGEWLEDKHKTKAKRKDGQTAPWFQWWSGLVFRCVSPDPTGDKFCEDGMEARHPHRIPCGVDRGAARCAKHVAGGDCNGLVATPTCALNDNIIDDDPRHRSNHAIANLCGGGRHSFGNRNSSRFGRLVSRGTPAMSMAGDLDPGQVSSELRVDIFLSQPREASVRLWNAARDVLNEEERQRARRFVFDRDRDMYVFSHGLLRLLLARYMAADPRELTFACASGGRPELVSPSSAPIRFNLSHADGLVGCILTQKADCGLDVEQIGRVDYRHLVSTVLAPEERSALLGLAEADRPGRFCEIWTLKEAYLKGRGLGISYPIRNISFSGFEGNRRCRVRGDERDDGSTWHFWSRPFAGAYSAAAAVRTLRDDVKFSAGFIEDLP